jgi:hypothetical protein
MEDYTTVAVLTPFLKTKTVNFLKINFNILSVIGTFYFLVL